jgi:2-oxo-4-hydroxy-4-carboxy-5-ureidoimidazoline decarboxylase
MATVTAAELGAMSKDEFVACVGGVYEHSPWVAERAHAAGPFETLTAIHKAMSAAVLVYIGVSAKRFFCAHMQSFVL